VDERELIDAVKRGDPAAERRLFDAHVDRVFRLAYRMTGDSALAEDYTQESFVRIFARIGSFRGESKLSTWIHRVATSVVLNGLRKRNRRRQFELAVEDTLPFDRGVSAGDPGLSVRLERAIDALGEGMRMVFVLHDVEGFKHHEIAEVLEVPVGTSKARLSRARAVLREQLSELPWPALREEA
jgi:RNA polymerase sigma-70 factor (ECF subfamily)